MQRTGQTGDLITEFKCKICGATIQFSINDPETYESKTPHKEYFGMQLTTVRVSHDTSDERHHNAIVIDQRGLFRGYRDAYSEPLVSLDKELPQSLVVHPSQGIQLSTHDYVKLLIIVDRQRFWVQAYLCPAEFRPTELARLVMERVEEAERIYDQPQKRLNFSLADMDLHVWHTNERIAFVSVKSLSKLSVLEGLVDGLLTINPTSPFSSQRALEIALRVIDDVPDPDSKTLRRLVTDPMIFTIAATPFQDRVNSIVERVGKRFPIAKTVLRPLLTGQSSLIDVLEDGYWTKIEEVFDMVDFINRRGLLG
ncbi:MAG: hypothetical protein ACTSYL_00200 [Candidatus Thorarchaeota archaeon]